jgi:hypothetical protein
MTRWFVFFALLLVLPIPALAQTATATASTSADPSVRFSFDWPQGVPWQSYSIEVQSDGKAHFNGTPHADEANDTDPYQQEFSMSAGNRQKIFGLAQKLNYFQGDFDSHVKHVAQTGSKTLQYQSPQIHGSATYNWSQNADVEELTHMFEGIAMTIDFGRKLAFQYRFDKLGMDERLKQLEDLQASHGVEELDVIAPMLRKIANDPNLMNISRLSAQRLLKSINQPGVAVRNPTSQ